MVMLAVVCAVPSCLGYWLFLHTYEVAALPGPVSLILPLRPSAAASLTHPAWFTIHGAKVVSAVAGSADGHCAAPIVAIDNVSAPFAFVACEALESCADMTTGTGVFSVVDARPWFGAANWDARTNAKCEAAADAIKPTNSTPTVAGGHRVLVGVSEEPNPAAYSAQRVRIGWAVMAVTSLLWPLMAAIIYVLAMCAA